ncbi:MAG: 4Fe-4S dicluster domain-containing protein [Terracidiphilus sp.]|jgi:formate hydrogenlyase subunit 6/NADH:ubiquinone oxidoreductase subunit I
MNILTMLWKNLWGGSRTMRFPLRPTVTENYRGLVHFDAALCSGCAICKMRCTAKAIEFKGGKGEFTWSYEPGQCTFCGRCVEGCKDHALSQDSECPPIYLTVGELKKSYTVARKPPAKPAAAPPVPAAAPTNPAPGGAN